LTAFYYHLMDRGWRPWLNSWVDWSNEVVTFPIYSSTKWVGYQRYRWNAEKIRGNEQGKHQRYFTHVQSEYRGMAVYGWDNCFGHGPLFVVEGIFDALKVTNCWWDCIALTTNKPTKQFKQWFKMVTRGRTTISLMDRGEPSERWTQLTDIAISVPCDFNDVGDMTLEQARPFIEGILK